MRRIIGVLGLVVVVAAPLRAQEAEVYGVTANPAPASDRANGYGIAFGAFLHLSDIFSPRNVLGRSDKRIGVRLGYARLRSRDVSGVICIDIAQCFPSAPIAARLNVKQATLLFEPYLGARLSVDVGAGVANYQYSGQQDRQTTGLVATVRGAARLTRTTRWWLIAAYERHGYRIPPTPADGFMLRVPEHSWRAGLSYRAPLGLKPRPEH